MKRERITVVIPRRGINDEGKGKKYALHQLISLTTTPYVWLRDDDVFPPSMTLEQAEQLLARLDDPDLLILSLRMTKGQGSLLERLQQAEYAAIQQLTIETAARGHAVMCSGANMIVKRERWLAAFADIHPELPSGDDMFLLESFKRRGWHVAVSDQPDSEAVVPPCPTWSSFWRQRMRWAGKAPYYTDSDIRRCGWIVVLANLLQAIFLPFLLVKFPFEYRLIKKRDPSVSLACALLLALVYPWYLFVSLLGGLWTQRHASTTF